MNTQTSFTPDRVAVTELSLPRGSGTLAGMNGSLGTIGPDGAAALSLPLPASPGRGYAPGLTLSYHSGGGNGAFGLGWSLGVLSVRRRTDRTPRYDDDAQGRPVSDSFIGPDGEALVPERDDNGNIVTTACADWLGSAFPDGEIFQVTRYFPRVEGAFHRLERWVGDRGGDLWVLQSAGGEVHRLGLTADGRLADPASPAHIAEWRIEDSLSPLGEVIRYCYTAENAANLDSPTRDTAAARYLTAVHYGNVKPLARRDLWQPRPFSDAGWLFSLVLDYGERGADTETPPPYVPTGTWPARQDPFSCYEYGFEHRQWRLCRQALMYHRFPEELGAPDTLVSRLWLENDESPVLSQLSAAQSLAYEPDGTKVPLPPLELRYTTFDAGVTPEWQPVDGLDLTAMQHCQWVDLYGEGIPGLLYRAGQDWRYRPAVRDTSSPDPDAVTWGDWQSLPQVPATQGSAARLMDINGDGYLDWVVTQPGLAGYFTLNADRQWSGFIPLAALPPEFFHQQAQFADLSGNGAPDLVLIGPRSVRLYVNQRDTPHPGAGFDPLTVIEQAAGVTLPAPARFAAKLIAFSDMLGSGQSHLVCVTAVSVTCWPGLGNGTFGQPVTLTGPDGASLFDADTFNPAQLMLADIDGTGTADLIYQEHDQLVIYRNQAGNGFAAKFTVPCPAGLTFNTLTRVQAADIRAHGVSTLIFSTDGPAPQHWQLNLVAERPWLLSGTNNNMGAASGLTYRSSAQYWLDEKQATPSAVCYLPFPVQVVAQTTRTDEITGNVLTQRYRYAKGRYDPAEREFRGFGYVESQDTTAQAQGTGEVTTAPLLSRSWYHTGFKADEATLDGAWTGDAQAITLGSTRLTGTLAGADEATQAWAYRALKGHPLRQETLALDAPDTPYAVSVFRYQVNGVQNGAGRDAPVVQPLPLEQADSHYDRIAADPTVSQRVVLEQDRYGTPTHSVVVTYPRRPQPAAADNPYPPTLPDDAWENTYDPQQARLLFDETRRSVIHLDGDNQQWRLALPDQQRHSVLGQDGWVSGTTPWLGYEALIADSGPLSPAVVRQFVGQQQVHYLTTPPDLQACVDHTTVSALDEASLEAYTGGDNPPFTGDTLKPVLQQAGYVPCDTLLPPAGQSEPQVWCVEQGFTTWAGADAFFRPLKQQRTRLTAPVTLIYDKHLCGVVTVTDVLQQTTTAQLDYRHLQPWQLTDINANTHEVRLDALGRVVATSVYGTEWDEGKQAGVPVGFQPVSEEMLPATVDAALLLTTLTVAGIMVTDAFSWMGQATREGIGALEADTGLGWQALLEARAITPEGYLRAARHQGTPLGEALRRQQDAQPRLPVHTVTLTADRYPGDSEQQVQMQVAFSDGFGRALQAGQKVPPGQAWQRNADGSLTPTDADADPRWAVSGRVERDNKGQAIRFYQPYFLNDWRFVSDDSARTQAYADTHCFDAAGRKVRVLTAAGYLRRTQYFPWFTVQEDENDTAQEVTARASVPAPDKAAAKADGKDAVTLTVTVTDAGAAPAPLADIGVYWTVQGGGRLSAPVTMSGEDGSSTVTLTSPAPAVCTVSVRVGTQDVLTSPDITFS
jgi:hypothetical protein